MPGKKPTYTGRDATKEATGIKHEISIHAPHTGRDLIGPDMPDRDLRISIHAPHAGRDKIARRIYSTGTLFQSTRPMRGATQNLNYWNPDTTISIHAPHTGRDQYS